MADERISYRAMVNYGVGPMAYTTQSGDFGLSGGSVAPVSNGIGAKLARLADHLTAAFAAQGRSDVDREMTRVLAHSGGRITDSVEREMMRKAFESDWSLPG
jgi:hypothetical protein